MTDLDDLSLSQRVLFGEWIEQYESAHRHASAEGIDLESVDVLDSYDRVVHPWMHGRRAADIADYLRGLIGK